MINAASREDVGNIMRRNATNGGDSTEASMTPQQERAAELLASGRRPGEVATALEIHRVTIWEWRRQSMFKEHLELLRGTIRRAARDRIQENALLASEVLGEVLTDPAADRKEKLAAARIALGAAETAARLQYDDLWPESKEDASIYSWRKLAIKTAKRAIELRDGVLGILNADSGCRTAGEYWSAAGLPETVFRRLEDLGPQEAESLCVALLERIERGMDTLAFHNEG